MNDDIDADELLRRYTNGERTFVGLELADHSVLKGANLEGVIFQNGCFSDIDARNANLRGATFRNVNIKCTDFCGADLTDAVFESVLIEGTIFKGAVTTNAVFTGMSFHGHVVEDFRREDWD